MSLTTAEVLAKVQAGNIGKAEAQDAAPSTELFLTYDLTVGTTLDLTLSTYYRYTKVIVMNISDGAYDVVVTTSDLDTGAADAQTRRYIYYTASLTHTVTPGYWMVFQRAMYGPSVFEGSGLIANPT